MYSVVLLAALSAGETAPQHGWLRHGHGYNYGSHYGASYGACYGFGYQGYPVHATGGWGNLYGGYWAGYACYGGCGGYNSVAYGAAPNYVAMPPTTYAPVETKTEPEKKNDKDKDKEKGTEIDKKKKMDDDDEQLSRAQVIFELPNGAKLFVDDTAIVNADTKKQFRTPMLKKGEEYYYELRAEVVKNGQTIRETKRITLLAGDVIKADFSTLGVTTGVAVADPR